MISEGEDGREMVLLLLDVGVLFEELTVVFEDWTVSRCNVLFVDEGAEV